MRVPRFLPAGGEGMSMIERCRSCGHLKTTHRPDCHYRPNWNEGSFEKCGCPAFVPPKGEP